MNGGKISGNTGSGGVSMIGYENANIGTFIMNDGEISDNTGRGVLMQGGTFTMNGGKISGNTSSGGGGGVFVSGTFTMNGGEISGNTVNSKSDYYGLVGGGVNVRGGTFTKTGGTITGYADDTVNGNVVKLNGVVQNERGHAVYVGITEDSSIKRRETTAGPGVNLSYSSENGAAGGWDN
jgi:hypothetical protein